MNVVDSLRLDERGSLNKKVKRGNATYEKERQKGLVTLLIFGSPMMSTTWHASANLVTNRTGIVSFQR